MHLLKIEGYSRFLYLNGLRAIDASTTLHFYTYVMKKHVKQRLNKLPSFASFR